MICPKCQHERTKADDPLIPDYQCPKCGVIYAKFKTDTDKVLENIRNEREKKKNKRKKIEEQIEHERDIQEFKEEINAQITQINFFILIPVIVFSIAVYMSYISPEENVKDFIKSLVNNEASELENFVDFKKLKINLKANIKADINKNVDKEKINNKYHVLGTMIGQNIADSTLDRMITPSGIKALYISQSKGKSSIDIESIDFDLYYDGYDWAIVEINNKAKIKLERHGFFSWKIINFTLIEKDNLRKREKYTPEVAKLTQHFNNRGISPPSRKQVESVNQRQQTAPPPCIFSKEKVRSDVLKKISKDYPNKYHLQETLLKGHMQAYTKLCNLPKNRINFTLLTNLSNQYYPSIHLIWTLYQGNIKSYNMLRSK